MVPNNHLNFITDMRAAASIFTTRIKKQPSDASYIGVSVSASAFQQYAFVPSPYIMNAAKVHARTSAFGFPHGCNVPLPIQLCPRDDSIGTKVHSYVAPHQLQQYMNSCCFRCNNLMEQ